MLAGTALLRLRLLGVPLERDEGEYAYMGQLILRGEMPYVAAHNMKLPGVYYAYAGILAVLGQTDVAIRVGLLAVNLASLLLLHRLGRRLVDPIAGVAAAAAYAVLSLSPSVSGFTANAEHFVVLPMLAAMLILVRRERTVASLVAAGALAGVAILMKQQGAAFVAGGVVWLLVERRRPARDVAAFALAAAAPIALTCLGMWAAGAFAAFWFWTVTYAREYVGIVPFGAGLRELAKQAGEIVAASPALWLLAALGASAPAWDDGARRAARFLAIFAVASAVAVAPGLRFSDHYFVLLLPAASLCVGVAASALARRAAPRRAPALAGALLAAVVAATLAQNGGYFFRLPAPAVSRMVDGLNPFPEAVEIARYLRAHTAEDEPVAVIGSEPEIYFYARRRAATSYIYTYPLMEPQPFARRMQEDMVAQLTRANPRFLVLVNVDTSWTRRPDSSRLLLDWAERTVNEAYRPVGVADIRPGGTVYRWDADAADARPASPFYVVTFERRS